MTSATILVGPLLLLVSWVTIYIIKGAGLLPAFGFLKLDNAHSPLYIPSESSIDDLWYPSSHGDIDNLDSVANASGVNGFIFNNSYAPTGNDYYGGYNYCNMPHVNRQNYLKVSDSYTLKYVEVIHRHHKRTPYAASTFSRESDTWNCNDQGLFSYGRPLDADGNGSASTYWSVYTSLSNPFAAQGFSGTCQFPQITRGGLDDSWQHGRDLFSVYHGLLGFLPERSGEGVLFRVTNNPITSQVAGMIINAMYDDTSPFSLLIQPASIDSLEPAYPCPAAKALLALYAMDSVNGNWTAHLTLSQSLFATLDSISGVPPSDHGFHRSWDHYFDNLSSRLCHAKPLPCNFYNSTACITEDMANTVFRLGLCEYSYIYRASPYSLRASTATFGVWVAELRQNIQDAMTATSPVKYRHNVAHDGSMAMLLSILQIDVMVWPGLGAEVVFEIYQGTTGKQEWFIRILWGGVILRSSYPALGAVDMLPVSFLLDYIDRLVAVKASKVPAMCGG